MLLNLSKIIRSAGSISFSEAFDMSDLCFGSSFPVTEPVYAEGTVRNSADVLVMSGIVKTVLHGDCDRCAKPFVREVAFPFEAVLVEELENEEDEDVWTFYIEDQCADLTDIIRTAFVLNIDTQLLCREDCAGLCFRCGKDLNDGPCDCQPEVDPRLAVLKELLKG